MLGVATSARKVRKTQTRGDEKVTGQKTAEKKSPWLLPREGKRLQRKGAAMEKSQPQLCTTKRVGIGL